MRGFPNFSADLLTWHALLWPAGVLCAGVVDVVALVMLVSRLPPSATRRALGLALGGHLVAQLAALPLVGLFAFQSGQRFGQEAQLPALVLDAAGPAFAVLSLASAALVLAFIGAVGTLRRDEVGPVRPR